MAQNQKQFIKEYGPDKFSFDRVSDWLDELIYKLEELIIVINSNDKMKLALNLIPNKEYLPEKTLYDFVLEDMTKRDNVTVVIK